jgi:hypothetical protein
MNLLQTFLVEANTQARDIVQEAFTLVGESPAVTRYGTFGDPEIMPVMTRQGYQDHLVTPLKVEASQFSGYTAEQLDALARRSIVRTQTGRTMFIQVADYTAVVVYTFILTDRDL